MKDNQMIAKKKRILTGIQSSGFPHLGNLLGAILPAIKSVEQPNTEAYFFIADYHSLTTIRDAEVRKNNVYSVAASWLASGLDTSKHLLYKQSDLPQVAELTWYLSCFTPFPMLANAHSFKDKSEKLSQVNAGLFTYPVLMAADILLYDAEEVPVGKDQLQHLEITRDIASAVNNYYEEEIFVIPQSKVSESVMIVPGTDGNKMSKSYGNTLDIFAPEKDLKKQVMSIVTDSTPLEEPKNPDTCNVFKLFSLIASEVETQSLREKYLAGGFGYGHAKKELLGLLLENFAHHRLEYDRLMNNKDHIDQVLKASAEKAAQVGSQTLNRVKRKMGF